MLSDAPYEGAEAEIDELVALLVAAAPPVMRSVPSPSTALSFGRALAQLEAGSHIRRASWPEHVGSVERNPSEFRPRGAPVMLLRTIRAYDDTALVVQPWAPTQTDLFARDWCVVQAPRRALARAV